MSWIIFMNENLLKPRSRKPKITIQSADGTRINAREVEISGVIKTGRLDVGSHVLRAWVEAQYYKVVR